MARRRCAVHDDGEVRCAAEDGTDTVVEAVNDDSTPAARQRLHTRRRAARQALLW